jgi:ribosome-binding factor A
MGSLRLHKVNELFKREIGQIIQRDLGNPNIGFTTVSHVEVSADLKYATVRVSVLGDDAKRAATVDELNKAAGFIQRMLGQRVKIRTMPRLQFKLDRSLDAVYRVEALLDEIHEHDADADAPHDVPTPDDEPTDDRSEP